MTQASSNLWALIVNDPTHPAVRALCEAVERIQNTAETADNIAARGREVGANWDVIGPPLRAAMERLGWRRPDWLGGVR